MKMLGFGLFLLVSTGLLSACSLGGKDVAHQDEALAYTMLSDSGMSDAAMADMLAEITPKIFYRDTVYLSGIMPDLDGFDKGAWLDQHVAPLFLNLGPAQLEEDPVFSMRSYVTSGTLPRLDVNGYYEITDGGVLFFSYSFLNQEDEWKWSAFTYDVANDIDADDYNDVQTFIAESFTAMHDSFGVGNLSGVYQTLGHASGSGASLDDFISDFSYIVEAHMEQGELSASLNLDTLHLAQFDSVRTDDIAHDKMFLIHGNVLTNEGAYILFTLGILPQEDGTYVLYDLLNYERHIKS